MLLDPLYYSFGDKEQKCWGVQVNVGGVQNMLGGCTNEVATLTERHKTASYM